MLKKKLCFYIVTHILWIFLDKLQEVFSVLTLEASFKPFGDSTLPQTHVA